MKKKLLSGAMLFTLMFTPQIVHGMHIMEGFFTTKMGDYMGGSFITTIPGNRI